MKNTLVILSLLLMYSCSSETENTEKASNEKKVREEIKEIANRDTLLKISFPSADSILIQADVYEINGTAPVILLCHQARYNKTEYAEIAPRLNELGFNCIAIDQRSGGLINDSLNITNQRAMKAKKPVDYLDAEKDILAAVDFAYNRYGKQIIIWGSSYSSTLALYAAIESDKIRAVISFSPGDYFVPDKKSLKQLLRNFSKPFFVTSSREEEPELTALFGDQKKDEQHVQFVPKGNGKHGSSALWESHPDHKEYWEAITKFLSGIR